LAFNIYISYNIEVLPNYRLYLVVRTYKHADGYRAIYICIYNNYYYTLYIHK